MVSASSRKPCGSWLFPESSDFWKALGNSADLYLFTVCCMVLESSGQLGFSESIHQQFQLLLSSKKRGSHLVYLVTFKYLLNFWFLYSWASWAFLQNRMSHLHNILSLEVLPCKVKEFFFCFWCCLFVCFSEEVATQQEGTNTLRQSG